MDKKPILLEDLSIEQWPNLIIWAVPIMFSLVFIEWGISWYQKKDAYDTKDFFAASTIGIVNAGISALIKVFVFGSALFFYNISPFTIPVTWWSFILCFFAVDFARYWAHRVAHEQRFWWATHITHHNSSKYNLSVSFRLSWTQHIKVIFSFLLCLWDSTHLYFSSAIKSLSCINFGFIPNTLKNYRSPLSFSLLRLLITVFITQATHTIWIRIMALPLSFGIEYLEHSCQRGSVQPMELPNQ